MTFGGEGSIKIDYNLVYSLWDEGKSVAQISKIINHSIDQIKIILKNYKNFDNNENN
jgi:hypothetical protein